MSDIKDILHLVFSEAAPETYGGYWQSVSTDTSSDHYDLNGSVNADRLAQAITDHFATLLANVNGEVIRQAFIEAMLADKLVTVDERGRMFHGDRELKTDQMVHVFADRLIEGLAGKAGER